MKNYSEFITEVNKHREDKLKGQLKGLEQKYQQDYDNRYMKPFQNKEVKKAQIAPIPFSSPIKGILGVDTRSEKERARDRGLTVKGQADFYDTEWGRMQGGPPKGP